MDEIPTRDTEPAAAPASPTAAGLGSRFLRYLPFITAAHFLIGLPALIASLAGHFQLSHDRPPDRLP